MADTERERDRKAMFYFTTHSTHLFTDIWRERERERDKKEIEGRQIRSIKDEVI